MTDTKATPRPWRMNPKSHNDIEDANGKAVYLRANAFAPPLASPVDAEAAQNLADILTAVNAFDALREIAEAAREIQAARRGYIAVTHGNANRYDVDQKVSAADKRLDAALAAIREATMLFKIATRLENGNWDVLDEFEAVNEAAAERYAEERWNDVEWYVLNANDENINA